MSKMPIAARLMAGGRIAYMSELLEGVKKAPNSNAPIVCHAVDAPTHKSIMGSLHNAVPFDVQVASELYWGNKKDYYQIDRDFGPMRMPYEAMWMEWKIPNQGYLRGQKYERDSDFGGHTCFACYIYTDHAQPHHPRGSEQAITAQMLAWSPTWLGENDNGTPIALNQVACQWAIDYHGHYVPKSFCCFLPDGLDREVQHLLTSEAKSNVFVACLALNLINCKNVTTAPSGVIPVRRSGREKRQGVPAVRFHTVVLPGMTVERGKVSRKQSQANADALALHTVRGHFKTFTKEKPLLGKHTGTYWWNPAVRGNAANGKIVQDYKIGAGQ